MGASHLFAATKQPDKLYEAIIDGCSNDPDIHGNTPLDIALITESPLMISKCVQGLLEIANKQPEKWKSCQKHINIWKILSCPDNQSVELLNSSLLDVETNKLMNQDEPPFSSDQANDEVRVAQGSTQLFDQNIKSQLFPKSETKSNN